MTTFVDRVSLSSFSCIFSRSFITCYLRMTVRYSFPSLARHVIYSTNLLCIFRIRHVLYRHRHRLSMLAGTTRLRFFTHEVMTRATSTYSPPSSSFLCPVLTYFRGSVVLRFPVLFLSLAFSSGKKSLYHVGS